MASIVNIRDSVFDAPEIVYIGRKHPRTKWQGSVLANPYTIGKDGDRDTVIAKYKKWLWLQIRSNNTVVIDELYRLQKMDRTKLRLVCWCSPQACHGQIILDCLEWLDKNETLQQTRISGITSRCSVC